MVSEQDFGSTYDCFSGKYRMQITELLGRKGGCQVFEHKTHLVNHRFMGLFNDFLRTYHSCSEIGLMSQLLGIKRVTINEFRYI